ncbi:MAG TPA: hypothetical protein VFQ87_03230 [Bradyrhizobium sp.]|nr:hypothetical protein [Bradyrhizobium sp.]
MTSPASPITQSLGLRRVQGEAPGEIVFTAAWRAYTFWLKHEYDGSPWEWIIVDGKFPVDFGNEPTEDEAAARLEIAIKEVCPDFGQAPARGLFGRLIDRLLIP